MNFRSIQSRMLLAAVLPAALVALLLASAFLVLRVGDNEESHLRLARLQIRQVASASEFGVFSANVTSLQVIALEALKQTDARSVVITDTKGQELVRAGTPSYRHPPSLAVQATESIDSNVGTDLLTQPIVAGFLKFEDALEPPQNSVAAAPQVMGHVVMEFSRDSLIQRKRDLVVVGIAITFIGLLFGAMLGVRLGRGVIEPILRVSHMIVEIGRGSLSIREEVRPDDPLRDIQKGLNQMADRLEASHDEMMHRIDVATSELRLRKEEAELATLAKSQFLAAASHDLRQPTHALGMFIARLGQLPHDAQTGHLVASLDASVHALQDLLDGLLDISKLDARAVKINRRAVPVNSVFDPVKRAMMGLASDKGLRLHFRPSSLWVETDPVLLQRIVLNLVSNAVRYTDKGSVLVTCRPSRHKKVARIEIWDSGMGIAPEHHQMIFKEFFQVSNAESDRSKGMGLGLNIVERTAHLLGHSLSVRSNLGKGSRFTVEVPLAKSTVTIQTGPSLAVQVPGSLEGLRVLVIEDDELARHAMASLLESWGCLVMPADGLTAAVSKVKAQSRPDVIVSDYRLGDGENGFDAISAIRTLTGYSVVACIASGDTDPELIHQARDMGLTILHKPVRPAKLRSLLHSLASQVRSQGRVSVADVDL